MDVQLKELLEKINKDGVETAEKKASSIVAEAEGKARAIVADAEKKAEKIIADARADAERAEAGGRAAIALAGRDLVLKTKTELTNVFKSIVENETSKAMSGKVLEDAVVTVVKALAAGGEFEVQLSANDFRELESGLKAKLSDELKKGLEIKPFASVESGFRLSEKDGGSYYNFSAAEVAENLSRLLNPGLAEVVKESAKE